LNPYLHLVLNGLLVTGGQLLMKRGAEATAHIGIPPWLGWLGVASLGSWWVWAGIGTQILGFLNWLYVLRWVPLSIAFPLASMVHVLIPLGSWAFLGESITLGRWGGIVLVIAGICVIAQPLVHAEETL
jgi:drug/metabolite transporter (DMT)-like permease